MAKTKKQNEPDAEAGAVKARVLTPCAWGEPDDVVEVSAEDAEQGRIAGVLDADPAAVAYAESLQ